MPEMFKNKKILMVGLDNSGKTSIILNFTGNRNLLSYMSLEPTTSIDIKKLPISDTYFHFWELGGQEKVRQSVLDEFHEFGDDAYKVIFVFDVQDIERYSKALDFFKEIIERFTKMSQFPEIIIFLHKFDPYLEDQSEFSHDTLQERLVSKIQAIVKNQFPLTVYKTTLYVTFQRKEF